MEITLDLEIRTYLEAQVAAGRFASISDAIAVLAKADAARAADLDGEDLSWAKPYLDQGVEDLRQGRTTASSEVHAELRRRFGSRD